MADVTPETITRIAHLGRLKLTPSETTAAAQKLSDILGHFAAIQHIATDTIPAATDASGVHNVWREDISHPEQLCTSDALLEQAPQTSGRHLKVHAVLDK